MIKVFFTIAMFLLAIDLCGQDIKRIKITELEKTIADSKTPLIINFWATFCIPCIKEIPAFEKLIKKYQTDSIKLLLVSLDLEEDYSKIKSFAAKRKFTSPITWLDETDADYFCPRVDSSWSGSIPASLFVNNKTGYRKFLEQELSEEQLTKEITATLGKKD